VFGTELVPFGLRNNTDLYRRREGGGRRRRTTRRRGE